MEEGGGRREDRDGFSSLGTPVLFRAAVEASINRQHGVGLRQSRDGPNLMQRRLNE